MRLDIWADVAERLRERAEMIAHHGMNDSQNLNPAYCCVCHRYMRDIGLVMWPASVRQDTKIYNTCSFRCALRVFEKGKVE